MIGALRHSKSHRAAVKRQWDGQMMRYRITIPIRVGQLLRTGEEVRRAVNLPAGAVVRSQVIEEYGRLFRLVVDVPRGAPIAVASGCVATCKGIVPKLAPGKASPIEP